MLVEDLFEPFFRDTGTIVLNPALNGFPAGIARPDDNLAAGNMLFAFVSKF